MCLSRGNIMQIKNAFIYNKDKQLYVYPCETVECLCWMFHVHSVNRCVSVWTQGGALGFSSDVFILDAVGGGDMNLGELADLTVANDNDLTIDVSVRSYNLLQTNVNFKF